MTPKEKAKELIEETFCFFLGDNGCDEFWTDKLDSKRASVRCVNEIIKSLSPWKNTYAGKKQIDYYEKTKKEIENYEK